MNVVESAHIRKLDYVFGDYTTLASLVKFVVKSKDILVVSMLSTDEKIRGITNKSIIFCEDYNRCDRLFKNLIIELKELNLKHTSSHRHLSIKVG